MGIAENLALAGASVVVGDIDGEAAEATAAAINGSGGKALSSDRSKSPSPSKPAVEDKPRVAGRKPANVTLKPGKYAWCSCGKSGNQEFELLYYPQCC